MRAPAFLALFALCATPLAAQDAEAVDPATDPRTRVLLLGDSISQGYHKTVVDELGADFHVVRPMKADGKGYENCEGTTKGVKELDRWLALDGGHWDVIHFNFGLHDLKHVLPGTLRNSNDPTHPNQAPIDVYERQLREITERLLATGAELIFATTTPVPEGGVRPFRDPWIVFEYNFVASKIMGELRVHVTPLYAYAGSRLDELQQPVNVHFKKDGSRRLGGVVADTILSRVRAQDRAKVLRNFRAGKTWQHNRQYFIDQVLALEDVNTANWVQTRVSPNGPESSWLESQIVDPIVPHSILSRLSPLRWDIISEYPGPYAPPKVNRLRTLQREGYLIEHLLIESHEGMYIPAHLYLPDSQEWSPPYAGVLIACGHAYEAKAHEPYQIAGAAFARHGMAALVFDPLDQGERIQAPKDDETRQQHWGTTSHNITGAQARLVGWSQAGLHAFDAMRCLDALEADPRIDSERLGMCGQSGGGTQTAQLSAVDLRIKASAPACYITSLPALARTIGPQDEEQNLDGQLVDDLDHVSYLIARAPRPTLICAAEDDFFPLEGTLWTFEKAKEVFEAIGHADNLQLVISKGGHNWGETLVSATVAFMAKHLDGREIEVSWSDQVPMTLEEAQVTPRGQVVWIPGERTIYDLIRERASTIERQSYIEPVLGTPATHPWETKVANALRGALGFRYDQNIEAARRIRGIAATEAPNRERVALLTPHGLLALYAEHLSDETQERDPEVAWLVIGQGVSTASRPEGAPGTVRYLDVICSGELLPTDRAWYGSFGPAGTDGAYGVLLGKSLLAFQVEQIISSTKLMQGKPRLVASGLPALAAAHAYALAPELFAEEHSIELPFESWLDLFGYDAERNALAYVVHDALRFYDLSDLLPKAK